jgi:hypothetical protein
MKAAKRKGLSTHINHCRVENLTASTRSLSPATSCSIRASVSLIRISWPFASSLMRPFSRFRSSLTEACVREISSRNREDSFARSDVSLSCDERVNCDSVESEFSSSERSLAKSTFCVYVLRSASRRYYQSTIHISQQISCIGDVPTHRPCYTSHSPSFSTMVLVKFWMLSSITSFSTRIIATACSSLKPSPLSL